MIDAPGGGGKIPLLPQYVLYQDEEKVVVRNYKYQVFEYPEVEENKPQEPPRQFMRRRAKPKKTVYAQDKASEQMEMIVK